MDKLMLIDGQSIMMQAFFGLPDFVNQAGVPINAVLGFFNTLIKALDNEKPDKFAVTFDCCTNQHRLELYSDYKLFSSNMPKQLEQQFVIVKDLLNKMNICVLEEQGYESIDIIDSIKNKAIQNDNSIIILTSDDLLLQFCSDYVSVDLIQLIDNSIVFHNYTSDRVLEEYGVSVEQFISLKSLTGHPTSNILGVTGIGLANSKKLILEYQSVSAVCEQCDTIPNSFLKKCIQNNTKQILTNEQLFVTKSDLDISLSAITSFTGNVLNNTAISAIKELGLDSLLTSIDNEAISISLDIQTNILDDLIIVEQYFSNLTKEKCIGVFPLFENKEFLGLGITKEENTVDFITCSMFITEDLIIDRFMNVLKDNPSLTIITKDLKTLLKLLPISITNKIKDVGLAAYLINPNQEKYEYEVLAKDFLNTTIPGRKALIDKMILTPFLMQEEPVKQYISYETYIPFMVWNTVYSKLQELNMASLYEEIELPTVYVLDHMEKDGIRVKKEELAVYSEMLGKRISELEVLIYEEAGEQFNINSPKQLGEILFEKLQLPGGKKTKTGYSTNVDVLNRLKNEYPIVSYVLEYRQVAKLKSTYADGLTAFISSDGRIHGTFNQTITATGRISSTEPNLQNIPMRTELGRSIRKVFIPKDDYVFVDADYSQIELRVLAHFSGDDKLIDAYRKEADIHAITASQVFNVPIDQVDSLMRRNAKAVNFGIVYGISAFGLAEDLDISRKEASAYIDSYFSTYPGVKEYLDQTITDAKATGMSRTLFGRIRQIPELTSSNFMQRNFGERVAMNAPIQGTAADIIKIAMIRVYKRLIKENCKSSLILQIHDELLIETHKDEVELVKTILEEEMMHAVELAVPLCIDVSVGTNWYEAK